MGIAKEIVAIFFVSIVLYLLLKDSKSTAAVITAAGGQITAATAALQGRDSNGLSSLANIPSV